MANATKGTEMQGFENPSKLAMNSKTAASVADAVGSHDSVLEPKYDGIRLLVEVTENGTRLYSRAGNSKTGSVPAIESEIAANFPPGTWLDGEAVAFNADGTQDWGGAQSVLGSDASRVMDRSKIHFIVFDLLAHGGLDARKLPLRQRRELIDMAFAQGNFTLVAPSEQLPATDEAHAQNLSLGFEGSMVKHLDAAYQSGKRSASSLKIKATDTVDAVVTGFSPGEPGSWIANASLIGAIEFTHYEDGVAVEGKCSGMTVAGREEITRRFTEGTMVGAVIEVSYMTKMPSGKLRHPQFKRIRTDKTAAECRA